jgi:iron complex transport system ATP-binding protein
MLALIGPNGSGKTTLLRVLSGLVRVRSGALQVCGMNPSQADRRKFARQVAVVGPAASLGFPFTVLEVVLMGRAPHLEGFRLESDADLHAARTAMEMTGTRSLAERSFDTLSSGEKQRVAMARALAQQPNLLLLDEPAAFLDIKQQVTLCDRLRELNRTERLTVVAVLHDLNLAALYFERIAMMKDGRLFAVGATADVMSYANLRAVFDTDVYVDLNELTGKLNFLPLPGSRAT